MHNLLSLLNTTKEYPLLKKTINLLFISIFIFFSFNKDLIIYSVNFGEIIDVILGFFTGITIFYISVYISRFLIRSSIIKKNGKTKSIIKENLNSGSYTFSVLFTIIYILIFVLMEEIIFRSIVLYFLIQKLNNLSAILISSALFSLYHFNNKYFQLYIMGILLSLIVLYTGNLASAIVAHITNNLMVFFVHNAVIREKRRNINE